MKNTISIALISASTLFLGGCANLSFLVPGAGRADAAPEAPAIFVADEAGIQDTLKEGETLWQFSERTTGSGFNWEKIAVLNSIEDERKVDAGLVLMIPPELALDTLK